MLTPLAHRRLLVEIGQRLNTTAPHLIEAATRIRDDQPGYPTATGGTGTRTSGLPTGLDRYLTMPDPAAHAARRLEHILRTMLTLSAELHSLVTVWSADVAPDAQPTIERRASGGDCVCCGAFCSGAINDRLRAGLCVACYHHHRRWSAEHQTSDRGEWMLERRRMLADETEVA